MPKTPPYSQEFKREAVQLLRTSGRPVPQLAKELGVSQGSLRNWASQHDVDDGKAEGLTSAERDELRRLRRENKILTRGRIMGPPSPLQRRLRTTRYEKAAKACAEVLEGIGVPEQRRVEVSEVDELWPRYISRLRDGGDARERWPAAQVDDVRRRIDDMREAADGLSVVWLALVDAEPVGVEVPATAILEAGLSYLVSPAGDLMLTTPDLVDGACIELNHLATGDEYEAVTWGRFRP